MRRKTFLADVEGAAAVEFALVAPMLILFLGLAYTVGESFSMSRKVEQAARTLTDLAAQQSDISAASGTYTYSDILNAAALILNRSGDPGLQMTLTEYLVDSAGAATVQWARQYSGGAVTAATPGNTTLANLSPATGTLYVLKGSVSYDFKMFGAFPVVTLTNSAYFTPRMAFTGVKCC